MGSALLYLAIVVMWLSVLLPMWLRRDRHVDDELFEEQAEAFTLSEPPADAASYAASGDSDGIGDADGSGVDADADTDADTVVTPPAVAADSADLAASPTAAPAAEAVTADQIAAERHARARRVAAHRRARILARRRRRLVWSILLVLASVVTAAVRVMPWWAVAPSGVLVVGYLAVLRVAVRADREQREKAARARAEHLRRQRERRRALAEAAREAEIIKFEARRRVQVFDQYSDGRRASGD
ncbi:divisome protein SepX/GlpR [Microbispora bryophytorum]|uniref:divisome protein SepX/GlpR n=1 Tax=Microbispora bryophytorum TaxID=1460882 RepID=UPI00340FF186